MAEAHALVSKVLDMLASATEKELRLFGGAEEVKMLSSNLQFIHGVIMEAERRQVKVEMVLDRLEWLKRVAYGLDDVLDECRYEILKAQFPTRKSKVWSQAASYCFPCIVSRNNITAKFTDLNSRVNVFTQRQFPLLSSFVEDNVTTPDTDISEVKDRDTEKGKLVVSLVPESSELLKLHSGSIVGMQAEAQQNIFGQTLLSNNGLPFSLKQCLLYCVIFPKGCRMSKDGLISLWMAHGFLEPTNGRDMEMVGHDHFHYLAMRSLVKDFEVVEKFNRLDKTFCKMHDTVHDFAKNMMGKDCLYITANSAKEIASRVGPKRCYDIYHLHVKLGEKVKFHDYFYNLKRLRSLVVSPPKRESLIGAALPKIFKQFTYLRSLSLSQCGLENIPPNINRLIHLKWLNLSKNRALKELPETICELYHLQSLSLNWCCGLVHFPKGVEKLTNLKHLKNDYTYFLLPKGIGTLSGLRKLPRITIDPKSKDTFSLVHLENLNNIIGSLTIFFMERKRDTLVQDAKQAKLEEKKHITTFSLNFPERAAEECMQQEDEELVEALKPPSSLEMLRITCYKGTKCPSWINTLTSLKRLKLWYWGNCEHLPALAKLPCLEYIEFCYFGRVKKVTTEFYLIDGVMEASSSTAPLFPRLKNLQLMNMMEWEEWSDYEGDEEVMPCLSYLSIENCPKLKALPNFIYKKNGLQKRIS